MEKSAVWQARQRIVVCELADRFFPLLSFRDITGDAQDTHYRAVPHQRRRIEFDGDRLSVPGEDADIGDLRLLTGKSAFGSVDRNWQVVRMNKARELLSDPLGARPAGNRFKG